MRLHRRHFIRRTAGLAAGGLLGLPAYGRGRDGDPPAAKTLSAYYLRAHMYTAVPAHVRADMEWMAARGTRNVCISLLEQDLWAAVENVNLIAAEAERVGMRVLGIPTRWAGLYAGAPKVPSLWLSTRPEYWVRDADGDVRVSRVTGPRGSVVHAAVERFLLDKLLETAATFPQIAGYVWDEPKYDTVDYGEAARAALGADFTPLDYLRAATRMQSRINAAFLRSHPDKELHLFTYAFQPDDALALFADIEGLTSVGCDGRPWHDRDAGHTDGGKGKALLGNGERFLAAAAARGKRSLWLVENHNLRTEDLALMERRLPEVVAAPVDHLIYYYYPRNVAAPERAMSIVAANVERFG